MSLAWNQYYPQETLTKYLFNPSMFSLWVKLDNIGMRIGTKIRVATWRLLELFEVCNDDVLTEHVEIQVVL